LAKGFYILIVDTPELLVSQMLIGQIPSLIDGISQAIVLSLNEILCHEKTSRVWCLNWMWSQNIVQWQMWLVNGLN